MSRSKPKGTRFENIIADYLTDNGLPSERIPLSGSLGGKYGSDVVIGTPDDPKAKIECKNRETIAKKIWQWLDGNDYLALKRNYYKPIVVMPLEEFTRLKLIEKENEVE